MSTSSSSQEVIGEIAKYTAAIVNNTIGDKKTIQKKMPKGFYYNDQSDILRTGIIPFPASIREGRRVTKGCFHLLVRESKSEQGGVKLGLDLAQLGTLDKLIQLSSKPLYGKQLVCIADCLKSGATINNYPYKCEECLPTEDGRMFVPKDLTKGDACNIAFHTV